MRITSQFVILLLVLAGLVSPGRANAQWVESNLRISVTPDEARVYVDGYLAGFVNEFDGQFQRLHLLPGQHEIVIYLEGYRSLRQHLYLGPNATRRMQGALQPLAPGEPNEPVPVPSDEGQPPPPDMPAAAGPPSAPPQPRPLPPPWQSAPTVVLVPDASSPYGVLSLRVTPGSATVRVDGQEFRSGSSKDHLIVQVAEGHHVVQVERKGYKVYTAEVDVDAGETFPMSITLERR